MEKNIILSALLLLILQGSCASSFREIEKQKSTSSPRTITKPLDDQGLRAFGLNIPDLQSKGDETPPRPGERVLGLVVPKKSDDDTVWTSFTLVLYALDKDHFQVMLQKRRSNPAGALETAGGHLKVGETWRQGALNELEQETGIKIEAKYLKYLNGGTLKSGNKGLFGNMNFFVMFDKKPETIDDNSEIDKDYGHQWVSLRDVYREIDDEDKLLKGNHGKYYKYFRSQLLNFCKNVISCDALPAQ